MIQTSPSQSREAQMRRGRLRAGMTLIEVVGVVSVLAILGAVIAPKVVVRIDQAARDAESTSLAALSEGFVRSALNTKQLPVAANMSTAVTSYSPEYGNIAANKRNLNRVYLADPNFTPALPYVQPATGTATRPSNARYMVISSIAKALPTINPANFDNIWSAPKNTVPSSLSAWGGRGEDLLIERIEIAPRFHKVVLMNLDKSPALGPYTVDTTDTNQIVTVSAGGRVAAYYMEGSTVNLYRTQPGLHALDISEAIREDVSFAFQNGRWGRGIGPKEVTKATFGELVDLFLQQPVPCDPESGATQQAVVNAFYTYLWGYADWAFGDSTAVPVIPPFHGLGEPPSEQYPGYTVVEQAQTHLSGANASFVKNLIE